MAKQIDNVTTVIVSTLQSDGTYVRAVHQVSAFCSDPASENDDEKNQRSVNAVIKLPTYTGGATQDVLLKAAENNAKKSAGVSG